MESITKFRQALTALCVLSAVAACEGRQEPVAGEAPRAANTGFPGSVSAGGATSGDVIAASSASGPTPKERGTPGIPQGAEGNVGGANMGGTTPSSSSIGGTGEKSSSQAAKAESDGPANAQRASPAAR